MKVVKIGGGCLKDSRAAQDILELIVSRGKGDIFVVSAFYGVTNMLIQGVETVLKDEDLVGEVMTSLKDHHRSLVDDLVADTGLREDLWTELSPVFRRLERYYYGIGFTREATPRMQDMVASFGERISAMILTGAVKGMGGNGEFGLPEDIGIVSDGKFTDASALIGETCQNLSAYLDQHMTPDTILFVPGFYGVCQKGEVTTFGRGGSDYSAAVVAAAASVDVLEIWKDTQGFMTADPDNIPHCRLIPTLTYDEAAELAYTGAGILHPRTVEPVKNAGIEIRIKNTFNPDGPGSLITLECEETAKTVKSVSYTLDVSVLRVHGSGVGARPGILSDITGALNSMEVNIKSVVTSQTCISLLFSRKDVERARAALEAIDPAPYRELGVRKQVALVSIVGDGLARNQGVAAKCFSAVSAAGVNIEMISFGSSDASLYFLVEEKSLDVAIQALHREFFESDN